MRSHDRWTRVDTRLAALVGLVALATRIAVRTTSYYSVDAGLLAVGSQDYDFASHRPHPPYYPLVVFGAHVLAPWLGPLGALTWMAIVASGLIAVGTYAITRAFAGRATAVLAAAIILASPIALRNGSVPLSYGLEGAASVAVAAIAWRTRTAPTRRNAILLGVTASLAVGIRPSSLALLAPMVLWAVWGRGRWAALLWGGLAGAIVTTIWLVPALHLGGGLREFLWGVRYQSDAYILADPVWHAGWPAFVNHVEWIAYHLRRGLPFAGWLLLASCVGAFGVARHWTRGALGLLAAWLLPGLAFYSMVYSGWPVYPDGYLMALVPAFAVLAALLVRALWLAVREPGVPGPAKAVGTLLVAAIALQPVLWVEAWPAATQASRDAEAWEASYEGFEQEFPANETALVTFYNEQWVFLNHREYLVWTPQLYKGTDGLIHLQVQQDSHGVPDKPYSVNVRDGPDAFHQIPGWVKRIAVIDGHPHEPDFRHLITGADPQTTTLEGGKVVTWFEPGPFQAIEEALSLSHYEPSTGVPRASPPT